MKTVFRLATIGFFAGFASVCAAQSATPSEPETGAAAPTDQPDTLIMPASDDALDKLLWQKRAVVVFADSPNDPRFIEQMELIEARRDALLERDVVVMTDTDASTLSGLRRTLRPRGFMLVLIGKDGGVKLRKPFPWDVRELSRTIDKMPMRQREMRDAAKDG